MENMDSGKLFIGGISWETNDEKLREYFQAFGEVVEAVIMKDRTTGRARGFGFVVFADASVAEKVVRERHVIDGRTVEAKKAVPRDDHQTFTRSNGSIQGSPGPTRTKKIFVGGLPSTVTESDFKRYFDQFGIITDVVVMYDHNTQRPRGFGFITYDTEEAVDKVLVKTFHELHGKMVEVKRAVPKELSPGPGRNNQVGNHANSSVNRASSLLNAYNQGYGLSPVGGYGMRMDSRVSPANRNGYPPFSPSSYGSGLNLDSMMSPLAYGRSSNSYYSENSSRYGNGSPIGYNDMANGGNGSLMSSTNRNMWSNGNDSYDTNNSMSSSAFSGLGSGNTGIFGGNGGIWGSSPSPALRVRTGSSSKGIIGHGREGNLLGGRGDLYGGGNVGISSSYSAHQGGFGDLYGSDPIFGEPAWRSSSPGLDRTSSFEYGLRDASADVMPNDSVGYVGGYTVTNRSNRGIAA